MAKKIWEFFVYDNPVRGRRQCARRHVPRQGGYQMAPLLREIFLSREFYAEASIRSQIKSPVQFLIQLLKQLEITDPPTGFPITAQQQLGQILFMPPNVAGWDWGQAWINTNTLLTRYNLAGFLTKGAEDGGNAMRDGNARKHQAWLPPPNAPASAGKAPTTKKSRPARCAKIPPNSWTR